MGKYEKSKEFYIKGLEIREKVINLIKLKLRNNK